MTDIKWLTGKDDLSLCHKLRKDVFCSEQNIKKETEFDSLDENSLHLLILENSQPSGTGRIYLTDEKSVHFGHIAIDKNERGKGFGKILIQEMIKKAKKLNAEKITINAQLHAVPFYEKQGFAVDGVKRSNGEFDFIPMVYDLIFDECGWFGFEENTEAAVMRKTFLCENVKNAKVQFVSLGFCEPYFNGKKLTEYKFIPAWTNYEKRDYSGASYPIKDIMTHRCYFLQYDISDLINNGKNVFSLHIGNGWYGQYEQKAENMQPYGQIKYCFKITLTDENGNEEIIVSDGSEKWKKSHIEKASLYLNETVNGTLFDENIFEADLDDTSWLSPVKKEKPLTVLEKQYFAGDSVKYSLTPTLLFKKNDKKMYDIGKNVSGLPIIKFNDDAQIGEKAIVKYCEILDENNEMYLRTTGGDWRLQCDTFINGKNNCPMTTTFTWRAGRLIEIEGNAELIRFDVVNSDVPLTSEFYSDNETLNWLFEAYASTQSNNIHSFVPSDCPHRERLGYTGDGQLCSAAAMTMYDSEDLYRKWLQDIADSQDIYNGHVQHTAPFYGGGGGPGGWGGAIAIVPYHHYRFYKDKGLIEKYYPAILAYIDYMEKHSDNGIVVREEEGGWCLGDWCAPENNNLIPESFVNTYYMIKTLLIAIEIAEELGKNEDIPSLEEKLIYVQNSFMNEFFDEETGSFLGGIQGTDAYAIDINMGDERTLENLVNKYESIGTYDTGIFGTDLVTRVLFEKGYGELAVRLMTNEGEISFYNMKKQGATTLWENWDGCDSHSHPMFGAVCEYLFKYILGIRQPENSYGFEKVIISPAKIPTLNVKGSITTKYGKISVEVKYTDGVQSVKYSVPEGIEVV
ncbi:MAG: GNAT family N-acetyltransferase [Clostridia bacterium]|nr:GNAT family N-acetyltransferase [Clostridia bacterium]